MVASSGGWSGARWPHLREHGGLGEVADRDGFLAAGTVSAAVDAAAEQVAVGAAAFIEVAGLAVGAFIDGPETDPCGGGHRGPPSGWTPAPARAWESRTLSPVVWQMWAWWSKPGSTAGLLLDA